MDKTDFLYSISKELLSETDLKAAGQTVLRILQEKLGIDRSLIWIYDDQTGELAIKIAQGFQPSEINPQGNHPIAKLAAQIMQFGQSLWMGSKGESIYLRGEPISRFEGNLDQPIRYGFPIIIHKDTVGLLITSPPPPSSHPEVLDILEETAELLGMAVRAARTESEAKRNLLETNFYLHRELKSRYQIKNVVGVSKQMQDIFAMVDMVCLSKATVLLRGESGTGKELIAHAIHFQSPRAEQPFIKVSCAALPETLLESELFGHEKGAFTGAIQTRKGRFEQADGGTLFLDEIGDIPLTVQTKLLRVLQEKKFERVGGNQTISVDIRLITATNRNLEEAVQERSFREDLYYRLNVIPIYIAPLRARRDDIPPLVNYFLAKFNNDNGKEVSLTPECYPLLMEYPWPGNVRELENWVERLVVMSRREIILPSELNLPLPVGTSTSIPINPLSGTANYPSLFKNIEDLERKQIEDALQRTGGVQTRAAKLLNITPRQIRYKIIKYGITYQIPE